MFFLSKGGEAHWEQPLLLHVYRSRGVGRSLGRHLPFGGKIIFEC